MSLVPFPYCTASDTAIALSGWLKHKICTAKPRSSRPHPWYWRQWSHQLSSATCPKFQQQGAPRGCRALFDAAISLFQCAVQGTALACKSLLQSLGWQLLSGHCGIPRAVTHLSVFPLSSHLTTLWPKWSVDQNSHKYPSAALYSQAKASIQLKCSTFDHALYFFLIDSVRLID